MMSMCDVSHEVFSPGSADALTEMLRASEGPLLMTSKLQMIGELESAVSGARMTVVRSALWAKAAEETRRRRRKRGRIRGLISKGQLRNLAKKRPHIIPSAYDTQDRSDPRRRHRPRGHRGRHAHPRARQREAP